MRGWSATLAVMALVVAAPVRGHSSARPAGELLVGACSFVRPPLDEVPATWRLRTRSARWRLVRVTDGRSLVGPVCQSPEPVWSPSGRHYAYSTLAGIVVRASSGRRVRLIDMRHSLLAWEPRGRSVTFLHSTGEGWPLFRVPIPRGRPRQIAGPFDGIHSLVWAPSGRAIYFTPSTPPGVASEVRRTAPGRRGSDHIARGALEDVSPDGRRLLLREGGDLWVQRPRPGARRRLIARRSGAGSIGPAAWSRDGRWIALAGGLRPDDPYHFRLIRSDGRVRHPIRVPARIGFMTSISWRPPARR